MQKSRIFEENVQQEAQVVPAFHGDRVMVLLEYYDLAPPGELEVEDDNKKKIGVPNPAYYT
jgi:hypothetical protein